MMKEDAHNSPQTDAETKNIHISGRKTAARPMPELHPEPDDAILIRTPDNRRLSTMQTPARKNKRSKRRLFQTVLLFLLLTTLCVFLFSGDCRRGVFTAARILRGEPAVVTLSADPAEAGRIHGTELKPGIRLLEKYYVRRLAPPRPRAELIRRARDLFAGIDPRWTEELAALSDAAGASLDEMMLGNCFLDLGRYRAGCRQLLATRPDGSVLHAHNLDWNNLGGAGQHWVTVFRVPGGAGRLPIVYFAFPGMIGALDVINSEGVALSFNQLGFPECAPEMPVFLKMREIAEQCPDFDTAEAAIRAMPPGMPFCIGLSHSKSGKIAVFERGRDGVIEKREPLDGLITADNTPQAQKEIRAGQIDRIARPAMPLRSAAEAMPILRDGHVLLDCNIYSLIFDFRNNTFLLASGEIPAAKGEYRAFRLF